MWDVTQLCGQTGPDWFISNHLVWSGSVYHFHIRERGRRGGAANINTMRPADSQESWQWLTRLRHFPINVINVFTRRKTGFHQVQLTIERRRLPDHHNFWQEVVCRQLERGRVEGGGWLVVKIKGQAAPGWLQKSRYW